MLYIFKNILAILLTIIVLMSFLSLLVWLFYAYPVLWLLVMGIMIILAVNFGNELKSNE